MPNNLSIARLIQLENHAWQCESLRRLYATPLCPGYPWFTVPTTGSRSSFCQTASANATLHADAPVSGGAENPPACTTAAGSTDALASEGGAALASPESTPARAATARRFVVPYEFTFKVFAKGRWEGRRVLDVYSEELPHHTRAYYEQCLATGRLCVLPKSARRAGNVQRRQMKRAREPTPEKEATPPNAEGGPPAAPAAAGADAVLSQGDVVCHTVHRHEIPVCLGRDSGVAPVIITRVAIRAHGLLVVDKPTGVPTHAVGRYHYNSLLGMLEYVLAPRRLRAWLLDADPLLQALVSTADLPPDERRELYDYYSSSADGESDMDAVPLAKAPRPCHRLDKVTSGVLLLAVHAAAAKRVGDALMRKSKAMDAAVVGTLATTTAEAENTREEEAGDAPESAAARRQRLAETLRTPFGLQKRYLAAVRGRYPQDSPALVAALGDLDGAEVLPLDSGQLAAMSIAAPEGVPASAAALEGVLVASPVEHMQFGDNDAEGGGGRTGNRTGAQPADAATANPSARRKNVEVAQSGVTAFVPLARTPACSLLLCVPYTGRLHQIRQHLARWGFPIVGDTAYAGAGDGARAGSSETIHFDASQLPPAFYERYYRHSPYAGGHGATCEPLCYECARRLPVAVLDERLGSSAARLHAYEYAVAAELLAASPGAGPAADDRSDAELITFRAALPEWAADFAQ